jgi:polyisoprenoid-binding protein YceI
MRSQRSVRAAVVATAAGLILAGGPAGAATLKLDKEHTSVGFRVRHLFTKVSGRFRGFEGTVDLDEKNLAASKVTAVIQAASVDTDVEARDKDLRGKRFFDAERFPTLTFTSKAVSDVSGNRGKVLGALTIHGVTRDVVLSTEFLGKGKDPWGNQRYGFHAETTINRKDFGLTWNEVVESGGLLVGDEVEIVIDAEAVPAQP